MLLLFKVSVKYLYPIFAYSNGFALAGSCSASTTNHPEQFFSYNTSNNGL